jgi:hypothetical protein
MSRRVFVQIPSTYPSGGIKVAHQLVNLFREHNYESYVVLPNEIYQADWLIYPAPTINISKMKKLCGKSDIVIDNWVDKDTIAETIKLEARIKVFYAQGCTFPKSKSLIGDDFLKNDLGYTHFWAVSKDSLDYLKKKYRHIQSWYLINPYFDLESVKRTISGIQRENKILCLSRKGGSFVQVSQLIFDSKIKFEVINKTFTEKEFYQLCASSKFFLSTAIGIDNSYLKQFIKILLNTLSKEKKYEIVRYVIPSGHKEGFPLPPAEAAMCGSVVIGFAMGGGLEWMTLDNCFLAKDRSYLSLIKMIKEALSAPEKEFDRVRENALKAVSRFNKEHTWKQIEAFLKGAEVLSIGV